MLNNEFFHRLTPNLTELITNVGVSGPLTASMIAAARYKYKEQQYWASELTD